jgi:phosphatidylglycerol:prolipoprotein diacylglycerol transferase
MTARNKRSKVLSVDTRATSARLAQYTTLWLIAFAGIFGYFVLRSVVLKLPVIPLYTLGPFKFNTFGPLVAMGILFGIHLTRRWCPHWGLEWPTMQAGVLWIVPCGFVVAHLLAVGEASPRYLLIPSKLFAVRAEFSSFGGFLGGTLATLWFCKQRGLAIRPMIDCLLYGFIGGWLFGRLGCFSVHDHPGGTTTWPTGVLIRGALRHDLAFYELLYTLALFAVVTGALHKKKRFDGFVIAVAASSYPLVRFSLDFLRTSDPTYAGLTLAQWGCLPLLALGIHALLRGRSQ